MRGEEGTFFDEEQEVWRAEDCAMSGVEGDFGAFTFGESIGGDGGVDLDLFVRWRATECACDERTKGCCDRGAWILVGQSDRERVFEGAGSADGFEDVVGDTSGLGDFWCWCELGVCAVEELVSAGRPLVDDRAGDLEGFDDDGRADGFDGRVGVVDEVPAFGDFVGFIG